MQDDWKIVEFEIFFFKKYREIKVLQILQKNVRKNFEKVLTKLKIGYKIETAKANNDSNYTKLYGLIKRLFDYKDWRKKRWVYLEEETM